MIICDPFYLRSISEQEIYITENQRSAADHIPGTHLNVTMSFKNDIPLTPWSPQQNQERFGNTHSVGYGSFEMPAKMVYLGCISSESGLFCVVSNENNSFEFDWLDLISHMQNRQFTTEFPPFLYVFYMHESTACVYAIMDDRENYHFNWDNESNENDIGNVKSECVGFTFHPWSLLYDKIHPNPSDRLSF